MKRVVCSSLFSLSLLTAVFAQEATRPAAAAPAATPAAPAVAPAPQKVKHGFGHKLLLYIPNRVFDVLDIARARVRLGPGFAVGFRVTKYTDVFLGAYKTAYLGLTGPRQEPRIPWPGGIECRSGLAVSVADDTVSGSDSNPRYSVTEIGAGGQLILAGAEVGVDVAEVFDLALGLLFIDFRGDDL